MQIANINFGSEVKTRPAVVLSNKKENDYILALKITTKAKMNQNQYKFPLSGLSGVHGYVQLSDLYKVPKNKVQWFNHQKLFTYEEKETQKGVDKMRKMGKLRFIDMSKNNI